ncbi:electron transfer flavoprotein subunit alpha/FixB family protein [Desulfovibrio ferrophilus]|uniref:Electron transfer flavoprotein alpha subunit-like protein n=1 Tax=Desulfovibrio ferrophilus TaxID=241368 RepID=A0A2Z6AX49_9BACT|nr:electron transfer flavoprotein subunit alpha [Desulfovibrio ferrophilus]BBD07778.1 electron transfer flavoprotein alpha subunit-like protein [Desulfovibrio ferrophilus]
MDTILYLAHTEADGSLSKTALEALSAVKSLAKGLGGGFAVGLVGEAVQAAADSVAGCGATDFYAVQGADYAVSRYATDTAACEAICKQAGANLVVGPATARFSRCLPGVAARLGGRTDTQCTGLAVDGGEVVVNRWYYRQRMESAQTRAQRPWVITVAPCCFMPEEGCAGSASLTEVAVNVTTRTEVVGVEAPSADEQTIRPEAEILFVAGAGWTKKQADGAAHMKQAEQHILGFLEGSKASLGSSKSLVDLSGEGEEVLSFMTHLHQVGQTGATPRHKKGLATCCHGEEPHVVGWRFITERRAVNLDPNCGWAQGKADVLYVADAFEVMTKVNEMLGK